MRPHDQIEAEVLHVFGIAGICQWILCPREPGALALAANVALEGRARIKDRLASLFEAMDLVHVCLLASRHESFPEGLFSGLELAIELLGMLQRVGV